MTPNELAEIAKRGGLVLWIGGSIEKMELNDTHTVVSYDANRADDPPGTQPRQTYSLFDNYFCVETDDSIFKTRTETQSVLRQWHVEHHQVQLVDDVVAFTKAFGRAYYLEYDRYKKMDKDITDAQFKSHLAIRCWELLISGYRVG